MSIEKIKDKILSKAKEEADVYLSEERKKIENERKMFVEQKNAEIENETKKTLLKMDNDKKRKIGRESMRVEREILARKRALIDELFTIVEGKFVLLDKKLYKEFLINLIVNDAPIGNAEIMVNENDSVLFDKKLVSEINKKLGDGKNISLSDKTANIKGGCIIKGNELEIDDSIETLLKDEREREEMSLAKELFGEFK